MNTSDVSVVMVHGVWADGSGWAKVISPLVAAGHEVAAAPLPLTSFDADVAALERAPQLAPDRHGLIYLPEQAFAASFAPNATAEEQALLAAVQQPIAPACISTPMDRPRWRDLPSWFLVAEHDYMILPETQRFMAERMRARVHTHPVDHTPLVTAPMVVVDIICEAIAEIRPSN